MKAKGVTVTLTISKVAWGDNAYTLIIYTNNPLEIDKNKLKMPFSRRLQEVSEFYTNSRLLLSSPSLELNSETSLYMS